MRFTIQGALISAVLLASQNCWSQHAHVAAGAQSKEQGSKLFFVNGESFVTNSGYVLFLEDGDPLYPHFYQSATTFTALPATLWTGGPVPSAAAQGSYLQVQVVSVAGPPGGSFGVWEENEDATATSLRFSVPTGTTAGNNLFNLSEGVTEPAPDPFGHIHGRRLSANKPGLYTVGFQILDTSTAGANGGPIHSPSDLFYMYLQAGLTISSSTKTNNVVSVTFGSQGSHTYFLERTSTIGDTNSWKEVAGPVGDSQSVLRTLTDEKATNSMLFYRLRAIHNE